MKLKICGLRDPKNIERLLELQPDFVGFIFYKNSKRHAGDVLDEGFSRKISGAKKVGVFVDEQPAQILATAEKYGLDAIQLHGNESPEDCKLLKNSGLQVIKAFSVGSDFDFSKTKIYENVADFFLFDTKGDAPGGNGMPFDWSILKKYRGETPFFLSGGIAADDAEKIVKISHPKLAGVDINSCFETAPGLKNVGEVARFRQQIRAGATAKNFQVNEQGYFGNFGGAFVPEMLQANVEELQNCYLEILGSQEFQTEFRDLLKNYVGRPTPLFEAKRLSNKYNTRIFLKREDLCHTGAHKINNTVGQILLAQKLGKTRIIAETGAGQHGVATATVCALMGLKCVIYMGSVDIARQAPNVARMKMLGATVIPATSGSATLKDATNEAIRDWISNPTDTHYIIGSVVGPHPYPDLVSRLQSVISEELLWQIPQQTGQKLPDAVLACVGGGSNAAGAFYHFLKKKSVRLLAAEAAGHGVTTGKTAATIALGRPGILHGSLSYLIQTADGQIVEPHSISAGLDYPGVGPLHSHLAATGRATYLPVSDAEALAAAQLLARLEGIIPALESAHAVSLLEQVSFLKNEVVVICLSGRGDKDLQTYMNAENL